MIFPPCHEKSPSPHWKNSANANSLRATDGAGAIARLKRKGAPLESDHGKKELAYHRAYLEWIRVNHNTQSMRKLPDFSKQLEEEKNALKEYLNALDAYIDSVRQQEREAQLRDR
jgi:hypothetical protein